MSQKIKSLGKVMDIENNLRKLRESRNWTQKYVAVRIGRDRQTVIRHENGKNITLEALRAYSELYGCREEEITKVISEHENEKLRRIRQAKSMSLEKAAKIIGTSADQLSKLERGERQLTTNWLNRILPAYGMTLAEFYLDQSITEHESEGFSSPEAPSFHGPPQAPMQEIELNADLAVNAFDLALEISFEEGYSREQAKKAAKEAAKLAYSKGWSKVTRGLILNFLELESEKT